MFDLPMMKSDPLLGWKGIPDFQGVNSNYPDTYVKLDAEGWRSFWHNDSSTTTVGFYGCSYLFGSGVPIEKTFGYLLNEKFPEFYCQNRAMPGYGTLQAFLNLQRDLRRVNAPKHVCFFFLDVHVRRNVASPLYVRNLQSGLFGQIKEARIPKAGIDMKKQLSISRIPVYHPSLIHQDAKDFSVDSYYAYLVTKKIFLEAKLEAQKHDATFSVFFIRTDREQEICNALKYDLETSGVNVHDVSEPRGVAELKLGKNDFHLSVKGHALYAEKIYSKLNF